MMYFYYSGIIIFEDISVQRETFSLHSCKDNNRIQRKETEKYPSENFSEYNTWLVYEELNGIYIINILFICVTFHPPTLLFFSRIINYLIFIKYYD